MDNYRHLFDKGISKSKKKIVSVAFTEIKTTLLLLNSKNFPDSDFYFMQLLIYNHSSLSVARRNEIRRCEVGNKHRGGKIHSTHREGYSQDGKGHETKWYDTGYGSSARTSQDRASDETVSDRHTTTQKRPD